MEISFVYTSVMEDQEYYSTTEAAKVLGVGARRVQQLADAGEIEGERHGRAWRLAKWSVHRYLEEHGPGRPRVTRLDRDRGGGSEAERELQEQIGELREELGRLRGRAELEEITRSTLDEQLRRERERADRLEEEARQLRERLEAATREATQPTEELEASPATQNEPESAESRSDKGTPSEATEEPQERPQRPWWRRAFGG